MDILRSFGRATNLITSQRKTYGLWYGTGDPLHVPAVADMVWLREGESSISLVLAVGKRLNHFVQNAPMEELVMRALKHLRGLACTIYVLPRLLKQNWCR